MGFEQDDISVVIGLRTFAESSKVWLSVTSDFDGSGELLGKSPGNSLSLYSWEFSGTARTCETSQISG